MAYPTMSLSVEVRLLSGNSAVVQSALSDSVDTLKRQAQILLGVGKGRLLDSSGDVLDGHLQIKQASVQNGDSLTLHISTVQVTASGEAFAAVLGDGSVVTWGHAHFGGDSSAEQDELQNVQQMQASDGAFAAILGDGSVVTWGHADFGGDSSRYKLPAALLLPFL